MVSPELPKELDGVRSSVRRGRAYGAEDWVEVISHRLVDNSVSVHHYCFPCIKSVSWIHGKTSKTVRR